MILVRPLRPDDIAQCEDILRDLPEWFGFETALLQYVEDMQRLPGLVADDDGEVLGFVVLHDHNEDTSELHVFAVRRDCHRQGIGRALLQEAEADLVARDIQLLEVKTLGPSSGDSNYAKTRAFYVAMGFLPLEETPAFWGQQQPALIMVKPLFCDDEGDDC
jgi:ribosomal protein S18 acetylase RimI-like enzyme